MSSLLFLSPTPPKVTSRSRLSDVLLLFCRALILLLLAIVSTGPPSDPLLGLDHSDAWASAHRYISIGATVLMAGAFFRQVVLIREHYGVIGRILERVKVVRAERGLDTEEETGDPGSA